MHGSDGRSQPSKDAREPVTIRTAKLTDADQIGALHVTVWQAAYRGLIADDALDRLDVVQLQHAWRQEIAGAGSDTRIMVAELGGRVVAYCVSGAFRYGHPDDKEGELRSLYVHPDAWGAGVGPQLLSDALAWLDRQWAQTALLVFIPNPRAVRCYQRAGFHAVGDPYPSVDFPPTSVQVMRRQRSRRPAV